jgi:serine/threonine protein kinase
MLSFFLLFNQAECQYCKSGDLGSLIRNATRSGVSLHEDKIWNIFLQITQALHHCHWPTERNKAGAARISGSAEAMGKYQVLHRDLKPENGKTP